MGFDAPDYQCVLHSEIDPQAASVLRRHHPDVPVVPDIHNVQLRPNSVDVLLGGIPCQDYSVAGNRAGLAGDRGALWWEFHRIAAQSRPRIVVVENVPGLLPSDGGRSFQTIVRSLVELGFRVAWRVLDARYFGVAQRRRRVFLVGSLGDGSCAEILFEPVGLPGSFTPRRETGQIAPTLLASGAGMGRTAGIGSEHEFLIPEVSQTLLATGGNKQRADQETYIPEFAATLTSGSHAPGCNPPGRRKEDDVNLVAVCDMAQITSSTNRSQPSTDVAPTLAATSQVVAFGWNKSAAQTMRVDTETVDPLLATPASNPAIAYNNHGEWKVRRLTPREGERLMGWPDDFTRWGYDGKEMSDTSRYRMIGNGVVGPISKWIARRIKEVIS